MAQNPLEQFTINRIVPLEAGGIDISFTNSSLWMVLALLSISSFVILGMRKKEVVPGRWQSMVEMAYELVANMIKDTAGAEAQRYFPFIFSLFTFILLMIIEKVVRPWRDKGCILA